MEIAIYGKGGIGKSTVSANLSAALAHSGKKVLQIGCIEAGGPKPGVGCAGRGIISAFEFLKKHHLKGPYDVVVYDVPGDVVCGGFAVPVRKEYADAVILVTSGEFMALYAVNNILRGIRNFDGDKCSRVAGMEGIRDAIVLLNGPMGCRFYHSTTSQFLSVRTPLYLPASDGRKPVPVDYAFLNDWFFRQERVPCTYLDGYDYVYGTADKLQASKRHIVCRRWR